MYHRVIQNSKQSAQVWAQNRVDMVVSVYTPVPDKTFFLDLKTGKTHIGPKTNSKQLLRRCFYAKKIRLPANHVLKVFRNHTKSWFAGKGKKMSIAPPAQKLLRIVFRTYICFSGFQIRKKCFVGDRCVSLGFEISRLRQDWMRIVDCDPSSGLRGTEMSVRYASGLRSYCRGMDCDDLFLCWCNRQNIACSVCFSLL